VAFVCFVELSDEPSTEMYLFIRVDLCLSTKIAAAIAAAAVAAAMPPTTNPATVIPAKEEEGAAEVDEGVLPVGEHFLTSHFVDFM